MQKYLKQSELSLGHGVQSSLPEDKDLHFQVNINKWIYGQFTILERNSRGLWMNKDVFEQVVNLRINDA